MPGLARTLQALRLAEPGAQVPAGEQPAIELAAIALTPASSCASLLFFHHETWLVLVWLGAIVVWRLGRLPMSKLLSRSTFRETWPFERPRPSVPASPATSTTMPCRT